MGAHQSIIRVNYEDVKYAIDNASSGFVLINTLSSNKQNCLISGTIHADEETTTLNKLLKENISTKIIVYGENSNDTKVDEKCQQLRSLGFFHVHSYTGGLFEWLLLQDIYGADMFQTTSIELEHLKFKGRKHFGVMRLTN